jgi:uncharacterized membrane protein YkvI
MKHVLLGKILVIRKLVELHRKIVLVDPPLSEVTRLPQTLLGLLKLHLLLLVLFRKTVSQLHQLKSKF